MNVGSNIKALREKKGLTQEAVCQKVGITQAMLCQIERGTKNPSLQVSVLIAEVLGCDVEDFTK